MSNYLENKILKDFFELKIEGRSGTTSCPICNEPLSYYLLNDNYWFHCKNHVGNIYSFLYYTNTLDKLNTKFSSPLKIQHEKQLLARSIFDFSLDKSKITVDSINDLYAKTILTLLPTPISWSNFKNNKDLIFVDYVKSYFNKFGISFQDVSLVFIHYFVPGYITSFTLYTNRGIKVIKFDNYLLGVFNYEALNRSEKALVSCSPFLANVYDTILSNIDGSLRMGAVTRILSKYSELSPAVKQDHIFWLYTLWDKTAQIIYSFEKKFFLAPKILPASDVLSLMEKSHTMTDFISEIKRESIPKALKVLDRLHLSVMQKHYLESNLGLRTYNEFNSTNIFINDIGEVFFEPHMGLYTSNGRPLINKAVSIKEILQFKENYTEYVFCVRHYNKNYYFSVPSTISSESLKRYLTHFINSKLGESIFISNKVSKDLINIIMSYSQPRIYNFMDQLTTRDVIILPGVIYKKKSVPLLSSIIYKSNICGIYKHYRNCNSKDYFLAKTTYSSFSKYLKNIILKYSLLILQQYNVSKIPKTITTSSIPLLKLFAEDIGVPVITDVSNRTDTEIVNSSVSLPFIVIDEKLKDRKIFSRFYLRNCLIASFKNPCNELDLGVENSRLVINVIIDYLYKCNIDDGKVKLKRIFGFFNDKYSFNDLEINL